MRGRTILKLTAVFVLAAGTASAQTESMDSLYAKAKKEGQVVFGGAIKAEHVKKLATAFNKTYPGIAVKYTRRSTEPMVQLIETERRANRVTFDVLNLTEPGDVVRWIKQGFLASVPIPECGKMAPGTCDPKGYYAATGVTPMLGIYNTRVIKPGEAPKSLKALATDPKWKGKIAISRPTRGGTSSAALMNVIEAVGRGFLKTARDHDILLTLGNEAAINAVVSGERPVSWGVSGYRAIEARADGSPIEVVVWEEGVALAQFIGVVPDKAPHPNAARLFYRWLMTTEGQELIVTNANLYSARKDIAVTPLKQPPLSAMKINYFSNEKVVGEGHALAVEFDKAVGL
jgi:iron(III) transport system substrate-binding protein